MTTHHSTPQRLYLMQVATRHVPEVQWPTPYPCYLIQMSDGKHVLIDTGFPKDLPARPGLQSSKNVVDQLALLDLRPDDIDILICTHFDVDHAGYNDSFASAELIVQREHYELARSGHPRFALARAHWDHPALRYRLVDGDTEFMEGLTLLLTNGHAPGHQSVLLRLPQTGPVLLAIDAVMMQRLFTMDRKAWPKDDNEDQLLARTRKLFDLVEREQVQLVVFGHDGQQWKDLKRAPEYYD